MTQLAQSRSASFFPFSRALEHAGLRLSLRRKPFQRASLSAQELAHVGPGEPQWMTRPLPLFAHKLLLQPTDCLSLLLAVHLSTPP